MTANELSGPTPDAALDADTAALLAAVEKMTPGEWACESPDEPGRVFRGEGTFIIFEENLVQVIVEARYDRNGRENILGIVALRKSPALLRRWQERAKKAEAEISATEDYAAIGKALLRAINRHCQDYHWNESPAEILLSLVNKAEDMETLKIREERRAGKVEADNEKLRAALDPILEMHRFARDSETSSERAYAKDKREMLLDAALEARP